MRKPSERIWPSGLAASPSIGLYAWASESPTCIPMSSPARPTAKNTNCAANPSRSPVSASTRIATPNPARLDATAGGSGPSTNPASP